MQTKASVKGQIIDGYYFKNKKVFLTKSEDIGILVHLWCSVTMENGLSVPQKKKKVTQRSSWFSWWKPVIPTERPEFQFSVPVYKVRSCSVCLWLCSGQKQSDPLSSLASQPDSVENSKFSESPYLKTTKAESIWGNTQCWPLASTCMNWPLQARHTGTDSVWFYLLGRRTINDQILESTEATRSCGEGKVHRECPMLPELPFGNVRQPGKGPRVQMTMVAKQCTVFTTI